jgi:hypothetical protein
MIESIASSLRLCRGVAAGRHPHPASYKPFGVADLVTLFPTARGVRGNVPSGRD